MKLKESLSKSERTKQYIIERVAPVFNKYGYAGTSLTDITKATGLTKGSIYGNFKDKDHVAVEAFKYNLSVLTKNFIKEIDNAQGTINKLLAYPKVYRRIYKKVFLNGGCPILNTAAESDDTHPILKKLAKKGLLNLKNSFERLIIEGIRKNEIKKETVPDETSGFIISIIEGSILVAQLTGEDKYFLNAMIRIENIIKSMSI